MCKRCRSLPTETRRPILARVWLQDFLRQSNISEKNIKELRSLTVDSDPGLAAMAQLVLETALMAPRKRRRIRTLLSRRADLLEALIDAGLIPRYGDHFPWWDQESPPAWEPPAEGEEEEARAEFEWDDQDIPF